MAAGIVGGAAAFIVGTGLGTATIFGVVSSQTSPPSQSQVNVEDGPQLEYGTTN